MKEAVTVRFPAPLPAEIVCPICEGNKCHVCEMTGKIKLTVDAKVPIQRHLIVKYVADNLNDISSELSKHYGLTPSVETLEMVVVNQGEYETVKVSSLGGVLYIVNRMDELASPRFFKSYNDYKEWKDKGGWD
tara:strand:- start:646 stop:1044 length:399 start_codon:yes stop_codon:yes gene_type:complete